MNDSASSTCEPATARLMVPHCRRRTRRSRWSIAELEICRSGSRPSTSFASIAASKATPVRRSRATGRRGSVPLSRHQQERRHGYGQCPRRRSRRSPGDARWPVRPDPPRPVPGRVLAGGHDRLCLGPERIACHEEAQRLRRAPVEHREPKRRDRRDRQVRRKRRFGLARLFPSALIGFPEVHPLAQLRARSLPSRGRQACKLLRQRPTSRAGSPARQT